jgi:hypothetical protein
VKVFLPETASQTKSELDEQSLGHSDIVRLTVCVSRFLLSVCRIKINDRLFTPFRRLSIGIRVELSKKKLNCLERQCRGVGMKLKFFH